MFEKIKENKFTPYLIIILLGIVISIPMWTLNLAKTGEYLLHIIRIAGVKECISDGVFPPLISYKHMNGFGYGINIFYGIVTTYVPLIISYLTNSIALSIKICAVLSVILSGIAMYCFTHNVTKSKVIGVVSALLYMSAPYVLTDIYERCAFGEYVAFIFIPIIFNGLYYLINGSKKGNLILILGASFLILTHTITTIYTIIFAIMFLLFNIKKLKNTFFWKNILVDMLLILLVTAVYTIPIIEHKLKTEYVIFNAEAMNSTPDNVYEKTNSPIEWFRLIPMPAHEMDFSWGIPIIFFVLITILTYKKIDIKYKKTYNICLIFSIISLVMCTKIFPWKQMPHFLTIIQFAWRMQVFFIFFISIVCGINAYILIQELSKNKTRNTCSIIAIIFLFAGINISNKLYEQPKAENDYEKLIKEASKLNVYNVNRDYMPQKAYLKRDWLNTREDITYVNSGKADIKNEKKEKLHDNIEIEVYETAELELPYLYYLGYTTTLNGEKIDNYESDNGMIAVKVDKGGTLEVQYEGTTFEKLGYIISGIGIILVLYKSIKEKEH